MANWALLSYQITPLITTVTLIATTSSPAHLFAHWTTIEPAMDLLPRIRRGLELFCYPTWAYQSQGYIEQTQPGETYDHTFEFPSWPPCTTRWLLLSAQTDLSIRASSSPIIKYHHVYAQSPVTTYCRPSSKSLWTAQWHPTYLAAHDSTQGYVYPLLDPQRLGQDYHPIGAYRIYRAGIFFDNPYIAPSATILTAELHFRAATVIGGPIVVCVVSGENLSEPLVTADYHDLLAHVNPFGTAIVTFDAEWCSISFNSAGIASIKKNEVNAFGLRTLNDINSIPPTFYEGSTLWLSLSFPAYLHITFST